MDDPILISKVRVASVFASDTVGFWDDRILITGGLRLQQIKTTSYSYLDGSRSGGYKEDAEARPWSGWYRFRTARDHRARRTPPRIPRQPDRTAERHRRLNGRKSRPPPVIPVRASAQTAPEPSHPALTRPRKFPEPARCSGARDQPSIAGTGSSTRPTIRTQPADGFRRDAHETR